MIACLPVQLMITGTGKGYSVLEMVTAMEKASGRPIKYVIGERRPGDLDEVYSDPSKVRQSISPLIRQGGSGCRGEKKPLVGER